MLHQLEFLMVWLIDKHSFSYTIYIRIHRWCYMRNMILQQFWQQCLCIQMKACQIPFYSIYSFLYPHFIVRPNCFPNAMFLTLTTLLLMLAPVFFTNWKSSHLSWAEFVRFRVGTFGVLASVLGVVIPDIDKLGLGDLEPGPLTFGTDRWWEGVLVSGKMSERSGSEISDSEKLLVLDRDDANLFTEFTRSTSLP